MNTLFFIKFGLIVLAFIAVFFILFCYWVKTAQQVDQNGEPKK